ncbi:hypothetical protein TBLA_0I03310 [Henningerozyma blattae CBS 6284]|uniref:SMP-LTD domain-containing protein n=1 Tax=Henningerozyma blattae (strain ATCC 34711 / CBS 6284 / DSM 70876 / NBRC 10599 / NRRL Y-10934 / UCD 77-7) TaxID=1071380 RepID=I2H9D4_HENB6|nr:hypothetical protein TBLA_0I03310 [Tetrapisispora blattae CBS 6284]CCH62986.1 hypothetical protein TBLA_0I03310 [Tetrapisispora blattae CBS 6284]
MSFQFNEKLFAEKGFNEVLKEKLCKALNSFSKLDILKSEIQVYELEFERMPEFEILDLNVQPVDLNQTKPVLKAICKIAWQDISIKIKTEIESNLLYLSIKNQPEFIQPEINCNDSFDLPIIMNFKRIQFKSIMNCFVKQSGVGITFNDVILDFQFDCSIKFLQNTITKRLKNSMNAVFKSVLPELIFSMSQTWFNKHDENENLLRLGKAEEQEELINTKFEENEINELSPVNMLKLSTIISSRQTLSLNSINNSTRSVRNPFESFGCIYRANLPILLSRLPSLNNAFCKDANNTLMGIVKGGDYDSNRNLSMCSINSNSSSNGGGSSMTRIDENQIHQSVVETNSYSLEDIIGIQNKLYERQIHGDTKVKPNRRKIRLSRRRHQEQVQEQVPSIEKPTLEEPPVVERPPIEKRVTLPRIASALVADDCSAEHKISAESRDGAAQVMRQLQCFKLPDKCLLHYEDQRGSITGNVTGSASILLKLPRGQPGCVWGVETHMPPPYNA